MAYTPTEWKSGDVITAEKLNKLEEGVASAGDGSSDSNEFIINVSSDSQYNVVMDKTFDEVEAAYNSGKILKAKFGDSDYRLKGREISMGGTEFRFVSDISIPFFLESATSTIAYVGCLSVSNNLLKSYTKVITLTFG